MGCRDESQFVPYERAGRAAWSIGPELFRVMYKAEEQERSLLSIRRGLVRAVRGGGGGGGGGGGEGVFSGWLG